MAHAFGVKMNLIPFTQYLLPNGRKMEVGFECTDSAVFVKAQRIIDAGYILECETLTTGEVSFTIHDPRKEEDVAIQVCDNDKAVPSSVSKLINDFDLKEG